jgi:hypothetical protein
MGSTGSGSFGTYQVENSQTTDGKKTANGDMNGGTAEIECPPDIAVIHMEDIAASNYYSSLKSLPSAGSTVSLYNKIYNGRLVVKDDSTGKFLGNLPTQYNFLINCIKKGVNYTGNVIGSGSSPIPYVDVTLHA